MLSRYFMCIIAKKDKNIDGYWLPLWMHLQDTAGIMKKLVNKWIPDSIINACGVDRDMFLRLAVFLAAIHDCGKATSYFQSLITYNCTEMRNRLNDIGLLVKEKICYVNGTRTPHAYSGQCILQSGIEGIELDESIINVIGAHHGRPMDERGINEGNLLETYPANFFGEEHNQEQKKNWSCIWKEILENALNISGIEDIEDIPKINTNMQVLLSGLLIAADWLASNTDYFPLVPIDDKINEDIYPSRVNDGWKKCRFPERWDSEINILDDNLFEERFGFWPNDIQLAMLDAVNNCLEPGIFILEAQMGCGKTEAALSATEVLANRADCGGVFFALPTQATSNGIYDRLCNWAEHVSEEVRASIMLAHSGAEYNEKYQEQLEMGKALVDDIDGGLDGLSVHPWFQGNKKALLANFVIGTVDQLLMGALKKKHFMLRHLGLAGKVAVIDEVHAYDAYMNSYLDRMLEWLASYKIPVILLSATLPAERRKELISTYVKSKEDAGWMHEAGYPLLTWTDGKNIMQKVIPQSIKSKCVGIKMIDGRTMLTDILNEKLSDGGCACIITNTVRSAQQYYDLLKGEMDEANIILYHAQFLMPDRVLKEKEVLARMGKGSSDTDRRKLVLIGTQVLEQSLDYDADIMFTELCPVDLLLQRVGRLHRHDRNDIKKGISRSQKLARPECYILMDEIEDGRFECDDGSKKIYGEYLLTRTKRMLPDQLNIPDDIPALVQSVYCVSDNLGLENISEYLEMREKYFINVGEKKSRAKAYRLRKPQNGIRGILTNDDKSADSSGEQRVRDTSTSIEVILMRDAGDGNACFMNEELYGRERILLNRIPDNELARRILRQRIKLPQIFSTSWMIDKTIDELEELQKKKLAEWQASPWLSGELIMLFDRNNQTSLNGYKLYYDFFRGLVYKKQEDVNEGERVLPVG